MIKGHLFNLILYAQEETRKTYLQDIARQILEKFPCKIIFISGDSNPHSDQLNVTTDDEIHIEAGAQKLPQVPFLVVPQLIPDLPVYLIWGQDPTSDNQILPYLEKYATRLIFDSECTISLQRFSREMLLLMDATNAQIMDINWAYISGWREVLAKVFSTPETIEKLRHAETVNITYNHDKKQFVRNHETQAIYLQAWLGARLGWKFSNMTRKDNSRIISYNNTTITLTPSPQKLLPGAIVQIAVQSNGCEYIISRKENQPKVISHITTQDRCELPFTLSLPDMRRRSVFMREIFYQNITIHYKQMLEAITPIRWEEQ